MKREQIKMWTKRFLWVFYYVLLITWLLPFFIALWIPSQPADEGIYVPYVKNAQYASPAGAVVSEEALLDIVSAEMPASAELDAIKAQVVASRTYALRKLEEGNSVYDGQAHIDEAERKKRWGSHWQTNEDKIRQAIFETAGEIMLYDGEPILAAFHAQSAGKTEDSQMVWTSALPYLTSVDSSWEEKGDDFITKTHFSMEQLEASLGVSGKMEILSRSEAGYVLSVQVADQTFTGAEIRQCLGLRSTAFTVEEEGDGLTFTVKGYGHGVGMSQRGAMALAAMGWDYHEILSHYYTGVSFGFEKDG